MAALAGCSADEEDGETGDDDPDDESESDEEDNNSEPEDTEPDGNDLEEDTGDDAAETEDEDGAADDADETDDADDEGGDETDDEPEEEEDDSSEEGSGDDEDENEGDDGEADEDGQLIAPGESHSFEGEGATASEEFSLSDGIATVEFSHDGERNFIVDMLDLEGDEFDDQLLVNVIGSIEGRSVIPVGDSQYQLDVDADGAWSITLDQPGVTEDELEQLPLSAEGTGPDFVGPVRLEGVTEVAGSHTGESNFIVEARTAEGGLGSWDLVFNEVGEFEGSGTTRAEGIAWIDINADGDWSLEIGG